MICGAVPSDPMPEAAAMLWPKSANRPLDIAEAKPVTAVARNQAISSQTQGYRFAAPIA